MLIFVVLVYVLNMYMGEKQARYTYLYVYLAGAMSVLEVTAI